MPVYICSTILLSKKSCKSTTFLREMQVLERETSEKTKNEAKKQDKMKKSRRNESQKQKIPKFLKLGRRLQEPCYKFADLLSYCINYGVAVTLADLAATDGVNYIVAEPSADARVGGRSSSGSNVGRLAGAEAQQGEKYVKKFLHFFLLGSG